MTKGSAAQFSRQRDQQHEPCASGMIHDLLMAMAVFLRGLGGTGTSISQGTRVEAGWLDVAGVNQSERSDVNSVEES
jgi:hypothetical protein